MNEDRLAYLEEEKTPWLFSSENLKEFIEITPSVKTRLAMIVLIGPRLLDPRAKIDFFLGLFRFSEEKEKVQEVLKTRTHVLTSSHYRQKELNSNLTPTGSGENAAPKPFIAIPGLAKARERVTKPIVKTRKASTGDVNDQSKPPGKGTRLEKVPEAESSPPRTGGKSTLDKVFEKRSESPVRSRGTPMATKVAENRTASPKSVGRLDRVAEVRTTPAELKSAVKSTPAVELKSAMKSTPAELETTPAEEKITPAESKPASAELKSAMKSTPTELKTVPLELKSAMKNSSAPSPILSNGVIQMGNVTYNIGPGKNKPATPSNGPKNGESIKRPPATPVQPPPTEVHTISDDSDSDDLSDGTATESKNVTPSKPTQSDINNAKKLSVDVSLTHTSSMCGLSVPASPVTRVPASPTANSSGKTESSAGKVGRMFKAVFMKKVSPKGTPKEDALTLLAAREEKEKQEAALVQTKLQTDLAAAAVEPVVVAIVSDVAEKKHKNGTNGTVKQKKSVRMAVDTGSPTAQRNAISMSSMQSLPPRSGSTSGSMSPDQKTAIDIYASTEQARSWRKSTRFVNVKSLANGFDRMKERGEKQQKRRSQTPDRRHFPKTEEKHEEDEDDDEEKDDSTEPAPEPWYVTDKLGPGRSKRQTGDPSSFSDINRAGDGGPRRRSTNDAIAEKSQSVTGVFTPNGTNLVASHQSRDISYYQALPIEGPLETGADGKPLFRYQELVRRNVMRIYDGISHSEIESYLTDSEFEKNFGMGKVRSLHSRKCIIICMNVFA